MASILDGGRRRYFLAVAETLHFGRAARRLQMSRPPLSRQIGQPEQEPGAVPFRRSKRRVELTDAGAYLLTEARRLLADAALVAERRRRAATGAVGRLAFGFISAVVYSILPGLLSAFHEASPGVRLTCASRWWRWCRHL